MKNRFEFETWKLVPFFWVLLGSIPRLRWGRGHWPLALRLFRRSQDELLQSDAVLYSNSITSCRKGTRGSGRWSCRLILQENNCEWDEGLRCYSLFGFFFNVFVFLLGMVNKWNTCIGATCCSCCRQLWHIHLIKSPCSWQWKQGKHMAPVAMSELSFWHSTMCLLAKEGANGNKRCCFWKNLNPKRFNLSLSCNFSQLGRHPVLCWQRRTPCMWNVSSGGHDDDFPIRSASFFELYIIFNAFVISSSWASQQFFLWQDDTAVHVRGQ